MKIDIFDTTVPDYSILDKKSLMKAWAMNPKPVSAMRSTPDSSRRRWTTADVTAQADGLSA